jgi:SAM-dependent methyltransferase
MTERFDQAFWDARYGTAPALWSGHPNPHLLTETAGLPPGHALDIGCGEGADALWLAERGWRVTAVDISAVALDRARRTAAAQPVEIADRITWLQADLLEWDPPRSTYDLVNAQYFHLPQPLRSAAWPRLLDAVAPGGTLLVVAHDRSDPHVAGHAEHGPDRFFSAAELTDQLPAAEWTTITNTVSQTQRSNGEQFVDLVVRAVRGR